MPSRRADSRVAAIIATMNRPAYVRDAITSACEQTYGPLEVVIVDGSEDDRTAEVVADLRESFPERSIMYFQNDTPQGLPAARNQAVEATDAEYLAFLDDDDQWYTDKIARQVAMFQSSPEDLALVHTGFVALDDQGNQRFVHRPAYAPPAYQELLEENVIATPSTVMVHRSRFEAVRGFDETLRYCEDWDLYLRMARKYRVDYIHEPLVDHVHHDDAMTRDLDPFFAYRRRLLEKHDEALRCHGMRRRAWVYHYELEGNRYLRAGAGSRSRSAYRKVLSLDPTPDNLVLCIVLHTLPATLAWPTLEWLGTVKNRMGARLRIGWMASPGQ